MANHKDPLLVALQEGKSYTWTAPDGGNFASMRKAIKHGQTLTMSPVADLHEVQVGDIVLVKWHAGTLFHMVGAIQGDRFLIVNSLGKENGWVDGKDILGRVTNIVDPEPRPEVAGELLHGISIVHPGKVGDEYYMTKGHFHTVLDTAEVYYCLKGDGAMVMETPEGEWSVEELHPGRVLYVPPRWAHRSVPITRPTLSSSIPTT